MKKKFNPYGFIVAMIYLFSITMWIGIGIMFWKAIHVVSMIQGVIWFLIWNAFSGIIIVVFIIYASKFLDYVDKRFEGNPADKTR